MALAIFAFSFSHAQDKKKWDVNNPEGPFKEVAFTVKEGTWMNVDVSPDGKDVVFDLLGDIYSIPIAGGEAKVLRHNFAMEVQPRFSPDGKKILFTSDAGGGDNIWTMNRDGSDAKQVTKENFRLLNNATWSPDGQYIIAKKHFTSGRSLGAGELWIYHISGGDGLQLTVRKNDQQDVNEPSASSDGKYVYYSEDMYPGGFFQYNKDPNNQIFVIKRFDREKGSIETVTGGPGGACRPQISHDGKTLAFVKRVRTRSVLYLRNLETAEEWPIYDQLTKDQQEAWTTFGVYTGFSWMPGDKEIVIWSGGKILRIDAMAVNAAKEIPFTCHVKQRITDAVRFQQDINPDEFTAHVIRNATTSPDGKLLLFNAAGFLWKKTLPNGKPERLTNGTDQEAEPSFSADGKNIVYVTWNDTAAGAICKLNLTAGAKPKKITTAKAIYRTPSFSADGKWIAFLKDDGDNVLGNPYTAKTGVYIMDAEGKNEKFVSAGGESPKFNAAGDRLFVQRGRNSFGSYKLDGTDEKTIFKSTYGSQFAVSPDETWVAFVDLHNVYVAAFPATGKTIDISAGTNAVPVKKISRDAGINLHWSADNKQVHYTLGDQYYTINLAERFEFIANKPDSLFKMPDSGISVGLTLKTDKPKGLIAFTHAQIITMNGDEVIADGTILVDGNMIKAVGKSTDVSIPATAKQIDCKGKTIMPGFIDAHAHVGHFRSGLTPQKHWPYYTNLAYGVTTTHDPSANSEMVFAQSEMVRTGEMVGPRVFSTGTILYGADGDFKAVINSLDDARSALRRTKAFGAFSVKSYNQPRREQNQMVIQAARELKMEVVPEGGSFFFHNIGMVMDGHTTVEHNVPVGVLYDDVINLWKNSKTGYTPTLIVCYNAPSGEYYWYQHTNVWEKERLMRFTPRNVLDTRSRWRTILPEEEYENGHILVSKSAKKLSDAGVPVNMGAHGQIQGIGAHWEIWMMQQGGMSNLQALKTATINSATSLGLDTQIGSLQVGKLADLIVMDKDPLADIHNTESIRYTMVNGRLYDSETMNETGNYNKPRGKFYWENGKNAGAFPWHEGAVNSASEMDLD
ncbi:amidohydrolase family protein [Ferruginibacter sp. HRS2-29]|uniref:amidohydrolase family protein n=1 Tax=Ferruginibacter sp. HRS2-29 TaxID=2487334 RepID=UPI0020CD6A9C|nr:amidohydrolase family protein [Ferruginibacter sp. HRS2-29]